MTFAPGTERTTCRACNSGNLEQILDFGLQPLAGAFLRDAAAIGSEHTFPLAVHVCVACGLVQILRPVDPEILFQDYSFSSSTIAPLVDHFRAYATDLVERFGTGVIVEFGCNDGVLLAPLKELGARPIGVDPSRNITNLAREKGLDVVTGYFDVETAKKIKERVGAVDVVTGSNAFAHNDQPDRILEAAREVLKPSGVLGLEVMYAGDLFEQLQWDTLYHEHLTFYSLSSLSGLLERFGFFAFDAERLSMHGGSLRVYASGDHRPRTARAETLLEAEKAQGLGEASTWREFARTSLRKIGIVRDVFAGLARTKKIWAYGAAGKATMWVNACDMSYLGAVVDASPLRAGKLMPGTHTPIVFPDEMHKNPPDVCFVTAWNYADLIRSKETWFDGMWATPLPSLRFF